MEKRCDTSLRKTRPVTAALGGWMKTYEWCGLAALLTVVPVVATAQHNHGGGAPAPRPATAEQPPRVYEPSKPDRIIEILATADGFVPGSVTVKAGDRVRLIVKRGADNGAPSEFILDEFLIWRRLSPKESITEQFTTARTGDFSYRNQDGTSSGVMRVE